MKRWYWDDAVPRPGWQNMAIDRLLAERAGPGDFACWRLYRWDRSTMSFGANEAACRTWNRIDLERESVPCVRRPTGGRGVWHDHEDLTYAVAAPIGLVGGLRVAYRRIHEHLAAALRDAGVPATVAPIAGHRPTLAPGACFDLTVGGEILVAGRKTVGSAQAVFGPALLQHGAIARADRRSRLARFRLQDAGEHLDTSGEPMPAPDLLARAIVTAWAGDGAEVMPGGMAAEIVNAASANAGTFRDPAWTWRR